MEDNPLSARHIAELMAELQRHVGRVIVVKIGGNSIDEDPAFLESLARQLAFLQALGLRLVVIHGAGPQIDRALKDAGLLVPKRPDGRRPTSAAAMEVVERVMRQLSESIGRALALQKCPAFVAATERQFFMDVLPFSDEPKGSDNRAGTPTHVAGPAIEAVLRQGRVAVLHCLGIGPGNVVCNTNADDCAMAVAMALKAHRLLLATNVPGVLNAQGKLIETLSPGKAELLFSNGTIKGGMIPKVQSAFHALHAGVGGIVILDGHAPWGLVTELLTRQGTGTMIAQDEEA